MDPASIPTLRALAVELNRNPTWIVAVGVRPKKADSVEQQAALGRAFAVVDVFVDSRTATALPRRWAGRRSPSNREPRRADSACCSSRRG